MALPMAPRSSRDALLEKRRQIEAKLKALDARDREQRRKDDTHRKIILGGLVMAEMDTDPALHATIRKLIEEKAAEKDRTILTDWLASVAAGPMDEAARAQEATAAAPAPQAPNHEPPQPAATPAKSSLILPGQEGSKGSEKPPTKPTFIVRP